MHGDARGESQEAQQVTLIPVKYVPDAYCSKCDVLFQMRCIVPNAPVLYNIILNRGTKYVFANQF